MDTIYGYMSPEEIIIEREYMSIENEFLHLINEYESVQREHELNMKDIELKAILMEGCTFDDFRLMLEEEEQNNETKKKNIFQKIWDRIVKMFQSLIGKFDNIDPDKFNEEQKKKKLKLPKIKILEGVTNSADKGLDVVKNNIDSCITENNGKKEFDKDKFITTVGLSVVGTGIVGALLNGEGKKVLDELDKDENKEEVDAGNWLLKAIELKEKIKNIGKKAEDAENSLNETEEGKDSIIQKILNIIVQIGVGIGSIIDKAKSFITGVFSKKDDEDESEDNNDKTPENPKNVEDRSAARKEASNLKTDIMSFNNKEPFGTIGHEEKSKDGKPMTIVTVNDVQTFINNASKAKFSGDEKTKLDETVNKAKDFMKRAKEKNVDNSKSILIALRESVGIIDNIFEEVDIVDLYPYLYENVNKLYVSLFESLDLDTEQIDPMIESTNNDILNSDINRFSELLDLL